jgi:hypothetical protein
MTSTFGARSWRLHHPTATAASNTRRTARIQGDGASTEQRQSKARLGDETEAGCQQKWRCTMITITIRARDFDSLKYATLEDDWVKVERVDDCRCGVLIKYTTKEEGEGLIGVGELRHLAEFFDLAAEFYELHRRLPLRPKEIPFDYNKLSLPF